MRCAHSRAEAQAAISAEEAARLGADLTPLGGEKAGNSAGTIPAWDGGSISAAKAGVSGYTRRHPPDPFASEKPLFKINAQNAAQYAANLTVRTQGAPQDVQGHVLHECVPEPPHGRAYPQRIYDATKSVATTATLAAGGNGVTGAVIGIPFPIPKQGVEVFWNHVLRYRADAAQRSIGQAAPPRAATTPWSVHGDEFTSSTASRAPK